MKNAFARASSTSIRPLCFCLYTVHTYIMYTLSLTLSSRKILALMRLERCYRRTLTYIMTSAAAIHIYGNTTISIKIDLHLC